MTLYTGAPSCQRCGGSLRSDADGCWCGGRSEYARADAAAEELPGLAEALAELERRREPPPS